MSNRTCSFAGCAQPVHAKKLCGNHYEQSRERRKRDRSDRLLANRARTRALTRLAEMYPSSFSRLYDEELAKVKAENEQVAQELGVALAAPKPVAAVSIERNLSGPVTVVATMPTPVVPLKPGPRAVGQDPIDRVAAKIRELCTDCGTFHEHGHVCAVCAKAAETRHDAEARVRRLLLAGKSAQWLKNNGENGELVYRVLRELNNEQLVQRTQ